MKNAKKESAGTSPGRAFSNPFAGTYQMALEQLKRVKSTIFSEARAAINAPQHLVRLVLNEAEAESWQTDYPHLVFPALAAEKVQSLSAWSRRQAMIRRQSGALPRGPF